MLKEYAMRFKQHGIVLRYNKLMCKFCRCRAIFLNLSGIKQHISTNSHLSNEQTILESRKKQLIQEQLPEKVAKAFLEADIPLKKLRIPAIKELFQSMGFICPAESTTRRFVDKINNEMNMQIKSHLYNKLLFLMFDGSCKAGLHYINIMAGDIEEPSKKYLINQIVTVESETSERLFTYINDSLSLFNLHFTDVKMIISDGAPYNTKLKKLIKRQERSIVFITCFMHLLHNCAMKIRQTYKLTDQFIASVKDITVRCNKYRDLIEFVGKPPSVVEYVARMCHMVLFELFWG
ncbi:hypothetical protein ECANGB1_289 [Enterospora canceri]|uniref:C2H2-type domain-containing protein n=1 Tax=Enterospora canceri TaxID=1081671 RepID=A0A1Y1S4J3_9MICR|nr:hypothetical protein ECANGB1_289 [Enterospora canceri]